MFTQVIDPLDNLTLTCLVALIPVVSLLVMLAVFRVPAWLATLVLMVTLSRVVGRPRRDKLVRPMAATVLVVGLLAGGRQARADRHRRSRSPSARARPRASNHARRQMISHINAALARPVNGSFSPF